MVVYRWKSQLAGIGIILALLLCSLRTFYFSVVEVHQALVYPFLLVAWIQYRAQRDTKFLLIASSIVLFNLLTHPTTAITLLFIIAWFATQQRELKMKWPYLLVFLVVLFFTLRYSFFPAGTYESAIYKDGLSVAGALDSFWELPGIRFVLEQIWMTNTLFLIPAVLTLWSLVVLLKNGKLWLAIIFSGSITVFILTTSFAYQAGDSAMMMEKNFLALGVFIGLVFTQQVVLSKSMDQRLAFMIVLVLVGLKVRDIALSGAKEAAPRFAAVEQIVERARVAEVGKAMIPASEIPNAIKVDWALPVETMLASSLNGNTITVINENEVAKISVAEVVPETEILLIPYLSRNIRVSDLRPGYFDLAPQAYRSLDR